MWQKKSKMSERLWIITSHTQKHMMAYPKKEMPFYNAIFHILKCEMWNVAKHLV